MFRLHRAEVDGGLVAVLALIGLTVNVAAVAIIADFGGIPTPIGENLPSWVGWSWFAEVILMWHLAVSGLIRKKLYFFVPGASRTVRLKRASEYIKSLQEQDRKLDHDDPEREYIRGLVEQVQVIHNSIQTEGERRERRAITKGATKMIDKEVK